MKLAKLFGISLLLISCTSTPPPAPFGPLPSKAHLAWQEMEFNMFIHFNMNTFSNMEWGTGAEKPAQFNPTQLDTRQWARIAKAAGMKGIVLTAKHHDGFCLWPSKYTEHSVKNSPWKNGAGDVVKELADACREYDLKLGLYLSPWDRNHSEYGREAYITYFRNQLKELLTEYGDVFEVWFDGANGGTGYYGGANENRKIDGRTYYGWPKNFELVKKYQPEAMVFGDGGPGVRWVGNEEGWANATNWSLLRRNDVWPGYPHYKELRSGHEDGTHWIPAECDVSIRPGWYYHPYEDHKVRSLTEMVDIYYHSVGRNGLLLLNFPVDERGLIHEADSARVMELMEVVRADFAEDLAFGKNITADHYRGNDPKYNPQNLTDGESETYWATDDGITSGSFTIDLGQDSEINRLVIQEYIALGQRVESFTVEIFANGEWKQIASETTIGYKRILRFPTTTAQQVRINIVSSKACPLITNFGLYNAPQLLVEPIISRDKKGLVKLDVPETGTVIHYTTDGTAPTINSLKYTGPFEVNSSTTVKAFGADPTTGKMSQVARQYFDISKKDWQVHSVTSGDIAKAGALIDDDPQTWWGTSKETKLPQEIVIDLGDMYSVSGATYLPMQARWIAGVATHYEWYVSKNGKRWGKPAAFGEFSNIKNNPILQTVRFSAQKGRFLKLRAIGTVNNDPTLAAGEIGVITK